MFGWSRLAVATIAAAAMLAAPAYGAGRTPVVLFPGYTLNKIRVTVNVYQTQPSTYLSASDPAIFGNREVVIRNSATGRSYTPRDWRRLLTDAGLTRWIPVAEHYIGFVKFADAAHFPDVDVYAEKGSGIDTVVGAPLSNLSIGQVLDPMTTGLETRKGDINQEDITNNAVRAWRRMRCYHFSLTDNPGVNHFELPGDAAVLKRLVANLKRPRSRCG